MTSRWEAAVALLASAWSIRRIVILGKQKAKLRKGLFKKILVDGRVPDSDPLMQAVPAFIRNDFRELSSGDALLAGAQLKQYGAECGK